MFPPGCVSQPIFLSQPGPYSIVFNPLLSDNEELMARKIQAVWRGYCARNSPLSLENLRKVLALIVDEEELQKQPRPMHGHTPVYFPKDIPRIVIKACVDTKRSDSAKMRVRTSAKMRGFLQRHGCHHLVVPESCYNKEGFLIEERLPLPPVYTEAQIDLYCKNKDLFSAAVVDFTKLYCLTRLDDAVHGLGILRGDNFPFFINEEGKGLIGLIDLEHWTLEKEFKPNYFYYLYDLAVFFPYHCDQIIETAELIGYGKLPDAVRNEIKCKAKIGVEIFDEQCFDYLRDLHARGISIECPEKPPCINDAQKEELIEKMVSKLPNSVLGSNDERIFREKIFPQTVDFFFKECERLLKGSGNGLSMPPENDMALCRYRKRPIRTIIVNLETARTSDEAFSYPESKNSLQKLLDIEIESLNVILRQLKNWGCIYKVKIDFWEYPTPYVLF